MNCRRFVVGVVDEERWCGFCRFFEGGHGNQAVFLIARAPQSDGELDKIEIYAVGLTIVLAEHNANKFSITFRHRMPVTSPRLRTPWPFAHSGQIIRVIKRVTRAGIRTK